jgi:hypothetical protein
LNIDATFEIKGQDVFDGAWLQKAKSRWVAVASGILFSAARENLSGKLVQIRSRRMLESLRAEFGLVGDEPVGQVGTVRGGKRSHGFLGRLLETGVRPHEIHSSRRLLAFSVGGRFIRTRTVRHPGVSPRRWLATALEESLSRMEAALVTELKAEAAQASASSKPELVAAAKAPDA